MVSSNGGDGHLPLFSSDDDELHTAARDSGGRKGAAAILLVTLDGDRRSSATEPANGLPLPQDCSGTRRRSSLFRASTPFQRQQRRRRPSPPDGAKQRAEAVSPSVTVDRSFVRRTGREGHHRCLLFLPPSPARQKNRGERGTEESHGRALTAAAARCSAPPRHARCERKRELRKLPPPGCKAARSSRSMPGTKERVGNAACHCRKVFRRSKNESRVAAVVPVEAGCRRMDGTERVAGATMLIAHHRRSSLLPPTCPLRRRAATCRDRRKDERERGKQDRFFAVAL
nr:hypothetical protein Iba_chr04aCG17490 [Ipomoea batatas]